MKSCWLFSSSSNYAQICTYCTLKELKEVGGGAHIVLSTSIYFEYFFIFTYLLLFSLCGLEFYTTKTILYPFVFLFYIFVLSLWGEKPVIWLFGSKEVTVHGVVTAGYCADHTLMSKKASVESDFLFSFLGFKDQTF